MSAFIVDNNTIDRAIFGIQALDRSAHEHAIDRLLAIVGAANGNIGEYTALQTLGQAMLDLNVASVNERYNGNDSADPYVRRVEPCTLVQGYKSLRCYMYQSCEGKCHEHPLFKALDSISDDMAHAIVGSLREYDSAAWG